MAKILVTDALGRTQALEFTEGWTLMETLRDADYEEVPAICGGGCACATCHVHIDSEQRRTLLEPIGDIEEELVEMEDAFDPQRSRLSCQISLEAKHDGLSVQLIDNA